MKTNVLVDTSTLEVIKKMDKEMGYDFIVGLLEYGLYGKEPQFKELTLQLAFIPLKNKIDFNVQRYENCVRNGEKGKEYGVQGAEYGKLGGRPRKGETKEEYLERKKKETPKNPLNGLNKKPLYDDVDDDVDDDDDFFIKEKVKLNFFLKNLSNYEQETDRFLEFNKNTDSKMLLYYLKMWKPITDTNLFPKSVSDFLNEIYERGKDDKDIYSLMGLKEVKVNGDTVYFIIKDKKTFDIIEKYIQRDDEKFFGNRNIQYFPLKAEERKERERCSA